MSIGQGFRKTGKNYRPCAVQRMMQDVMFAWMEPTRNSAQNACDSYVKELGERAALLSRLGYPPSRTSARLRANIAWDFAGTAPVSDDIVADIVKQTYFRRKSR